MTDEEKKAIEILNILQLKVYYSEDEYGGIYSEEIYDYDNNICFNVSNLDECSEDAIIERGLFNSEDYISALNKGIELAKKGYTKVIGKHIQEEEGEYNYE